MDGRAIWGLIYDVRDTDRADYLAWFHDVHIPEKLARPGYLWAAHYEVTDADGTPSSALGPAGAPGARGYVGFFGGTDTSVFLDPSPAQLRPRQTDETRAMMSRRVGSRSFIATEEWRFGSASAVGGDAPRVIQLALCDTPGGDEGFGAWCAQSLKPACLEADGFETGVKLLATVGPARHITCLGFRGTADLAKFCASRRSEAPEPAEACRTDIDGSPFNAQRIWPA